MELGDFIKKSLLEIMKAVKEAQHEWNDEMAGGGVINPSWDGPEDFKNRIQLVSFDVAVTASASSEAGGGGGVKVLSFFDASGKASKVSENSTVSRISLSIPILPATITIVNPHQPS